MASPSLVRQDKMAAPLPSQSSQTTLSNHDQITESVPIVSDTKHAEALNDNEGVVTHQQKEQAFVSEPENSKNQDIGNPPPSSNEIKPMQNDTATPLSSPTLPLQQETIISIVSSAIPSAISPQITDKAAEAEAIVMAIEASITTEDKPPGTQEPEANSANPVSSLVLILSGPAESASLAPSSVPADSTAKKVEPSISPPSNNEIIILGDLKTEAVKPIASDTSVALPNATPSDHNIDGNGYASPSYQMKRTPTSTNTLPPEMADHIPLIVSVPTDTNEKNTSSSTHSILSDINVNIPKAENSMQSDLNAPTQEKSNELQKSKSTVGENFVPLKQ